jgi:sortase B
VKKVLLCIAILFALATVFFLGLFIYEQVNIDKEGEQLENIADDVVILDTVPPETNSTMPSLPTIEETQPNTEVTEPTQPTTKPVQQTPTKTEYKTPTAVNMIELRKKNEDVAGWVCLENSPINYPILYSSGNEYLNKNIYGKKSTSGSIFTYDTQNFSSVETMDKNLVLYGHNLRGGTMFSYVNTLYKNPNYLKNGRNKYIFIYNDSYIYKYQIYSVYKIGKNENFNQIYFKGDADFVNFVNMTYERSIYKDFNPNCEVDDYILTLSTCPTSDSKNYRMVLHAVLVEVASNNY